MRTDATLVAADPWSLVEGLAIAAFAIGATEAIIAIRAEDTALVTLLEGAILAAEEAGFLGEDVLGSGYRIDVTVRPVQGAYMLGEETVLLKALEGKRGQPEQRPPYPTERGLFDKPPSSTTSRRWLPCRGSSARAPRRSRRSAPRPARARPRPAPRAGGRRDRRGPAGHEAAGAVRLAGGSGTPQPQGGPHRRPDRRPAALGPHRHGLRFDALREAGAHIGSGSSSSPTTAPASSTSPGC